MDPDSSEDLFRAAFKRYKSRKNAVDLSEVCDFKLFHQSESTFSSKDTDELINRWRLDPDIYRHVHKVNLESFSSSSGQREEFDSGLKPISEWGIYRHDTVPGLVVIVDPFKDSKSKRYWVQQCLTKYHDKPNVCNLDAHSERMNNLWHEFLTAASKGVKINRTEFFKLRWVTLGYHYDWNTKLYYKDRHSEFPADLSQLVKYLANCIGYSYYSAEAGIVNYYHLDSTLAGHTDHSEYDMESPLFSISFGCDAIFLIGGETKSIDPVPIYLRDGDIVVMGGKSRLAYHAVPKIIQPTSENDEDRSSNEQDCDEKWITEYMKQSRININIRQVLKQGQEFPVHNTNT